MDFGKLKQRLGRRRGFDGNENRLGDFINDAYMTACGRRSSWSWLRRTTQFATTAPISRTDGTVTKGSRKVVLTSSTIGMTRSGGRLLLPDGTAPRILSHDATINAYIEAPYGGTTASGSASWTLLYDEFPLPDGAGVIESVICTGNGFIYHVKEESLLPQHMKTLTIKDYQSYPQYYALERGSQIPAPDVAMTAASAVHASDVLATGTYKYKYCYYDTRTQELGPFSGETSIVHSIGGNVALTFTRRADYGLAIYRTKAGGSEFYHLRNAATFTTTTYTDFIADTALGFSHQDTDTAGSAMDTNIGAISERSGRTSGTQRVRLWPPPDDEYMVDVTYFEVPQEMSLDTDTPLVPRQFHPVILDLAESYALSEEESHSAAAQKRAIAMEMLERMERDEDSDPGTVVMIGRGEPDVYGERLGDGRWPRTVSTS